MQADEIAAALGLEVVGRMPHGEGTGAFAVRRSDGSDAILKLFADEVANLAAMTPLTDALRARGYPIPAVRAAGTFDGTRYEIQERAAGTPMGEATREQVDSVFALNELQRAVGLPGRGPWLDDLIASVVDGCVGYCEHDAMRSHSNETRALLTRLQRIATAATDAPVTEADVVHYDFSPLNLLVTGNRVTAVVDWDGASNGDASFDLVTLAFYTSDYGVRDALLAPAVERTDPRALALYAAHMVLRQVDWSLRNHGADEVAWFMGIGTDLLAAVGGG